jgi:hypothetical protein
MANLQVSATWPITGFPTFKLLGAYQAYKKTEHSEWKQFEEELDAEMKRRGEAAHDNFMLTYRFLWYLKTDKLNSDI